MNKKTMFGVEYVSAGESQTFDIFLTYEAAKEYFEKIKTFTGYKPIFIFKADFNTDFVYEEEGYWNYDDCSDLIISKMEIL